MTANSQLLRRVAAFIALSLLATVAAAAYHRYSIFLESPAPRSAIRPPQPPRWSTAWKPNHRSKPELATSASSEEQVAVYRTFLDSYGAGSQGRLNLSRQTTPLEISGDDIQGCLTGLEAEPGTDFSVVHRFSRDQFDPRRVRLVDAERQKSAVSKNNPSRTIGDDKSVDRAVDEAFSAALLELSEVAFATGRDFAVLNFRFSCGSLCGNAGTLIFERFGRDWKRSERACYTYVN